MIKKNIFAKLLIVALMLFVIVLLTFSAEAQSISKPAEIGLEPGELEITSTPYIDFHFYFRKKPEGTQSVKGATTGYFVIEDGRGEELGWSVNVTLGDFYKVGNKKRATLLGTKLTIDKPILESLDGSLDEPPISYPVTMVAGDGIYYKVISAPKGTSTGAWRASIPMVELSFLGGAAEYGSHKATLIWAFEDTP